MSIDKGDFDSIDINDIQELINALVPEGLRLEYKLFCYGSTDSQKRELLKDVSAFANTLGGHLIIGIKETEGVGQEVVGVDVDADSEITRMEQIIRSALEPTIPGIRMRAIPCGVNVNKVILIRIPRSWHSPHRIIAQGINKFFMRHSTGNYEPSVEELRVLFNQSSSHLEKVRHFRNERINSVINGEGHRPLMGDGRLFVHIVPIAAFSGLIHLDMENVYSLCNNFWPLASLGASSSFNFHGFIYERGGDENYGYTQVFRNGALEATFSHFISSERDVAKIPGESLEKTIIERLPSYINGLKDIEVPPPLIIMISFEGIKGVKYRLFSEYEEPFQNDKPLPNDLLYLPECLINDYGTDLEYHKAIRPAFDALWNATGRVRCMFFNDEGMWVGK